MKFKTLITALTVALVMSCVAVPAFAAENTQQADNSLAAPSLSKTMKSTKKVVLEWNKVDNAKGYFIYKYDSKDKSFDVVRKVGSSKTSLKQKVKPGKTNVYRVSAYTKSAGKVVIGKASNNLTVKTPKTLKRSSKGFKGTNSYKVIKAARSKLGCAYVSGAAGPRAFDCSGYVYYIYNKVGSVRKIGTKKFSRTSAQGLYSQLKKYNIGRNVKKAQPGDIMLFSRSGGKSGIYHAALYYGNGKIIHASSPSTGVIISKIAHRKTAAIIRLPKM
jgi:cell wall-associated NlpC family hydrolase